MKKTLTLVLALVLVFSCFATVGVADSSLSAPGELPIWTGAEPAKLSILMQKNDYVEDYETNMYTLWLEEQTGIDIEFNWLPAADAADKLNIMITAGEKLSDVVNYGLNVPTAKSYGDAGAFINLMPYIEAGMAPNIDKAVAEFPTWNLISSLTNTDGTLYGVPYIQYSPANETKYKMWVNETWLKNLGLEAPTTTEEFYNMLVAFKEKDANGNGDTTDEIPFITTTGFGGTAFKFLTNAFVYEGDNDMFMLGADGNVTVSYIQDGWFEAADFMKKLVDEGLLMKESFTYSNNDLLPTMHKDENVVGATTNSSLAYVGSFGTENHDKYRLRYICIAPLTGPKGVQYTSYAQSSTTQIWFVTADCQNPELAFRVGDFQFTNEAFLFQRYGAEGINWMSAEDYMAAYPNATLDSRYRGGQELKYVWHNDVWDTAQNINWHLIAPVFSGNIDDYAAFVADDGNGNVISTENSATLRQEFAVGTYKKTIPGPDVYVHTLNYTTEELDEIAESMTTIRTYVNEQRTKYILGDASDLSDPAKFIDNLKTSFQLDRILEIANAAYARQYK